MDLSSLADKDDLREIKDYVGLSIRTHKEDIRTIVRDEIYGLIKYEELARKEEVNKSE